MKKTLFLFILLYLFSSFLQKNNTPVYHLSDIEDDKLVFVFAGDLMGHLPQFSAAYNKTDQKYDFNPCFKYINSYIKEADYAFLNLEYTLAGKPYTGYPSFSGPDEILNAITENGFDGVFTANNHVADRGKAGLERTISQISKNNLLWAGSYTSNNQRDSLYPLIINYKGFKIAILNFTYGTNMNPVNKPNCVNMLDSAEILTDIQKAKKQNADFIIAVPHWGIEYELNANPIQTQFANFLAENGVNLIIGSHPHVIQNFENIGVNSIPCVYSLGNFISNQRKIHTNGGIVIRVEININTKASTISYLPVYVHKGLIHNKFQYYLIPTADYLKSKYNFKLTPEENNSLLYFDQQTRNRLHNLTIWNEFNIN